MNDKEEIKKQILEEVEADPRCQIQPKNAIYKSSNDACFKTKRNSIVIKKFQYQTVPLPGKDHPLIQYFGKNKLGHDYVVGDIHCQWNTLEKQLNEIGFNKSKDRLFSVGDLIDRGSDDCYRVLDYLSQDWFHSVQGNHEDMVLSLLSLPSGLLQFTYSAAMQNGSKWLTDDDINLKQTFIDAVTAEKFNKENDLTFEKLMADFPLLKRIYSEFSKLPYLIQIEDVAIIHAEVPLFIHTFSDLIDKIENGHIETLQSLLWGRSRIEQDINKKVDGIDKIYAGHAIVQKADDYANHRMIDTGAYQTKSGQLHIEKIAHGI